jgi:hypothetical protein
LIDRRHFDHAALPIRITERCTTGVYVNGRGGHSPLDSIKPYQRPRFAAPHEARSADRQASDNNALLDSTPRLLSQWRMAARARFGRERYTCVLQNDFVAAGTAVVFKDYANGLKDAQHDDCHERETGNPALSRRRVV